MTNDFKKARLNLIALYLCIIGGIIVLFTLLVIYQANDSFSDPSVETSEDTRVTATEAKEIAFQIIPEGVVESTEYEIEKGILYFTTVFTDEREVKVNLLTGEIRTPSVKVGIMETFTDDFEERIVGIAFLVFALSALLSLYVANRTLRPIALNIRTQKQFVSDVAHELRNPLAALHARIESVVRSGTEMFKKEVLEDLMSETKHLILMSENLLALEKGEHGIKRIESQSLAPIVNMVIARLELLAKEKHIAIQTDIGTESLNIDMGDLETILYNLVHNALKFTLANGTIRITWSDKVLGVSDNGIGIPKEHILHIFDRFYKVNVARSDGGNGLGLALVKEIVERYGAKVKVSSTLGKGTEICIQFT